jgi:hypothetical protein
MEDERYYRPELNEFHVGAEYYHPRYGGGEMVRCIFDLDTPRNAFGTNANGYHTEGIFMKKLDRPDIESLSWEHTDSFPGCYEFPIEHESHSNEYFLPNGDFISYPCWCLNYDKEDDIWYIVDFNGERAFRGKIPNKSALKQVMEMVGITKEGK